MYTQLFYAVWANLFLDKNDVRRNTVPVVRENINSLSNRLNLSQLSHDSLQKNIEQLILFYIINQHINTRQYANATQILNIHKNRAEFILYFLSQVDLNNLPYMFKIILTKIALQTSPNSFILYDIDHTNSRVSRRAVSELNSEKLLIIGE